MMTDDWKTKRFSVVSLHLDAKNPRLGRETSSRSPREIIQYLFDNDKVLDVAKSIVTRGYFPNEPLLAIKENGRHVIVEGNRRLAALKALQEPGLLEGNIFRQVEKLSHRITNPDTFAKVPVTIAPSRRATDRQIVGRHIGTPVLAWQAENRASFILEKLDEGYENDEIRDELGFTLQDIQKARQVRAISEMARSIEIPEEVKSKLDSPRTNHFTTIERIFNSSVGREYLMVEPDPKYGIRGTTTKKEFVRGFKKLVTDIALGKQSSRSLNSKEDIQKYFRGWPSEERPVKKRGSFVPSDVIKEKSGSSIPQNPKPKTVPKRSKQASKTVLPRDFIVRFGNDRLIEIRSELTKLKREDFPNAGAVLLRVFFELSVIDFLKRIGKLQTIIVELKKKKIPIRYDIPTFRQLGPYIKDIAKKYLSPSEANSVEKAIRHDPSAPFTVNDLHAFVHKLAELPGDRDIQQFWLRTEPLFRLMLERDMENQQK